MKTENNGTSDEREDVVVRLEVDVPVIVNRHATDRVLREKARRKIRVDGNVDFLGLSLSRQHARFDVEVHVPKRDESPVETIERAKKKLESDRYEIIDGTGKVMNKTVCPLPQ
ncbi:MAG: hypothetical protein SXQ77_01030 [Halobacteria archaeon]|nr:hypothetical protein [Halobacteria archaeon]